MNNHRFGKSSEKLDTDNQIAFLEVDGEIVFFNEAEAIASITDYDEDEPVKTRSKKVKGKRAENLKDLPIVPVSHMMSEAELIAEFGENGWYQLEDEIYNRYKFTPAKVEVEEHHVGVYKSKKKDNHFKRRIILATCSEIVWYLNLWKLLLSMLSMSMLFLFIVRNRNSKDMVFISHEEKWLIGRFYVQKDICQSFMIIFTRRCMTITSFKQMRHRFVLQKENRTTGDKHYMWVYRTGRLNADKHIVLYEYQPSRNASHPRRFLKDFKGICVTDGYQVYHTIENEREDLKIAGCWAHSRRRFDEAVKALPKSSRSNSLAYLALKQIQAIYREENKLADMTFEERLEHRQLTVKPLVDAYFTWVKRKSYESSSKRKDI